MANRQRSLFEDEELAPWEADDRADCPVATVVFAEIDGQFDYLIPDRMRTSVEPGRRLRVPLGRGNRPVTAYCVDVRQGVESAGHRLKCVLSVVDASPLLNRGMLDMTRWLADYYLCTWGQAIEAAIPAGVRGQAGTREAVFLHAGRDVAVRLETLKLGAQQRAALEALIRHGEPMTPRQLAEAVGCSSAPIQQLRKKGLVVETTERVVVRELEAVSVEAEEALRLNDDQQRALDRILEALHARAPQTLLLHGITGSGKTEVYIRAIDEVRRMGRQAIVLVPEISLTPQTQHRFRSRFERVAVLHSHLSDVERHGHWKQIANGAIDVVVGARSAVFAPVPRLGLIVIDEEHDGSFKQDGTPRYHAREVAHQRCLRENAPLVLGSATPSLESYHAALEGRAVLLSLPRRVHNQPLPRVGVIDLRTEFLNRSSRGAISQPLFQAMTRALRDQGQIILLLNRRGFSTSIQCPACGHAVKCPHCDINLTHHRAGETAICHYCDYRVAAPPRCPKCDFDGLRYKGLGTQRLEAEVRSRFRNVTCLRMDSDTMQKPGAHEEALARFRRGEIQILLGTQMIAKGLDFPNVTLVGVINADTALHFPNFRAAERSFQLITQVAGRTGRGLREGRVLVQTFSPDHPAIQMAVHHDYLGFAGQELPGRRRFQYPPFGQMVRLIFRGPDEMATARRAEEIIEQLTPLEERHDMRIVGPAPAPLARLQGKYRVHVLLIAQDHAPIRQALRELLRSRKNTDEVQWIADVDPMDML